MQLFFTTFDVDYLNKSTSKNLIQYFGDEAPTRISVYRWYGEFKRDRSSLQVEFRESRPKSIVVPETINAVRQLIL